MDKPLSERVAAVLEQYETCQNPTFFTDVMAQIIREMRSALDANEVQLEAMRRAVDCVNFRRRTNSDCNELIDERDRLRAENEALNKVVDHDLYQSLRKENEALRAHLERVSTWVQAFGATYKELGDQLDATLRAPTKL